MESDSVLNTIMVGGICLGIGAAAMYLMDPERGRTRRAYIADRTNQLYSESGEYIGQRGRDLVDRAKGVVADAKEMVMGGPPKDEQIETTEEGWTPAARFTAAAVGGGLLVYGLRSKNAIGRIAATAGAGLIARSISNNPVKNWMELVKPQSALGL